MTLREQIEALDEPFTNHLIALHDYRAAVLDIIDQHECEFYQQGLTDAAEAAADAWAEHRCTPDRDALARAIADHGDICSRMAVPECADAIIAALEEQG